MSERFALTQRVLLEELQPGAGAPGTVVTALARLGHARAAELSFCDRLDDAGLAGLVAGALVLCPPSVLDELQRRCPGVRCLPVADARARFIDIAAGLQQGGLLAVSDAIPRPFGVHPDAAIGAGTIVDAEARVDAGARVGAQCSIQRGAWIREGAVVHDHATIGVSGINAYAGADGRLRGFPHLAGVIIGRRAQVGAGSVIVRGILTSTRVGDDCVLGNLCNVGHGAELGAGAWVSVGALIGGHARVGAGAALGMGVALRDNVGVGARAQVGMGSVVVRPVADGLSVFGNPARTVPSIEAGPQRERGEADA